MCGCRSPNKIRRSAVHLHGDGYVEVALCATERTLRADGPFDVITAIKIEELGPGYWTVLANVARYTATVVVYALSVESPEVIE